MQKDNKKKILNQPKKQTGHVSTTSKLTKSNINQ